MNPLSIGIAGASGLLGLFGANSKAKEAARRERYNMLAGAEDTRFSPYVNTRISKLSETNAGPGALGGLASGLLSGISQANKVKGMGLFDSGKQVTEDALQKGSGLGGMGKPLSLLQDQSLAASPIQATGSFNPYAPLNPFSQGKQQTLLAMNRR